MSAGPASQPAIIVRSAEKASIWFGDVASELGSDDLQYAYRALRAVLHVFRDRLQLDAATKLAAQLPTLIRGIYYEEWNPSHKPMPPYTPDTFLEHVVSEGRFSGGAEAYIVIDAVTAVLRKRLAPSETDEMLAVMPKRLRISPQAD